VFDTTRQFSNLFFQEKEAILNKIDFFLQNRDWYYEYGIPYTLGIGLYGKPGTGKTSFIKCLAKYTGRHVILLSFKHIRTKKQLEDCFYESQYHVGNEEGSIGFDKKILVMEDIDCIGDIVLDRSRRLPAPCLPETQQQHVVESQRLYQENRKKTEGGSKEETIPLEECLTLDDILNVLDGIRETPGRILVITSNHYDRLDPALVRPGRIDLTLPMTHASHATLRQMYAHFFKMPMHESVFLAENMSAEFKFSPAELVNMYLNSNGDPDLFLSLLMS
jgi:chaperone BCS1